MNVKTATINVKTAQFPYTDPYTDVPIWVGTPHMGLSKARFQRAFRVRLPGFGCFGNFSSMLFTDPRRKGGRPPAFKKEKRRLGVPGMQHGTARHKIMRFHNPHVPDAKMEQKWGFCIGGISQKRPKTPFFATMHNVTTQRKIKEPTENWKSQSHKGNQGHDMAFSHDPFKNKAFFFGAFGPYGS